VATRRVPDIHFRTLHVGKSYANLSLNLNLTLILTLYPNRNPNPTNPTRPN